MHNINNPNNVKLYLPETTLFTARIISLQSNIKKRDYT